MHRCPALRNEGGEEGAGDLLKVTQQSHWFPWGLLEACCQVSGILSRTPLLCRTYVCELRQLKDGAPGADLFRRRDKVGVLRGFKQLLLSNRNLSGI